MAPFGSSSDSNTIKRGGLLTVLHIFFKKISGTLQIRTAEGDAAPETGEGAERSGEGPQGRLQRIGAAPEPAAEGAAARKTVQRGGTARRAGRGKRQPGAADCATRRDSTQNRQGQKTTRRGRPCNAARRDAGPAGAKDCPARQTVQRGGRNGTAGACSSTFGPEE